MEQSHALTRQLTCCYCMDLVPYIHSFRAANFTTAEHFDIINSLAWNTNINENIQLHADCETATKHSAILFLNSVE